MMMDMSSRKTDKEIEPDKQLESQIRVDWQFLFTEHQAQIIYNVYDSRSFGNAMIIVSTPTLDFRIIRDRSQLLFEVAPSGERDEWAGLRELLEMLETQDSIRPRFAYDTELTDIGRTLKPKFSQLENALSRENCSATLEKLRKANIKRLREMGIRI